MSLKSILVLITIHFTTQSFALTFPLPEHGDVVGKIQYATAKQGETLAEVGRRYDVGSIQISEANPELSLSQPLHYGVKVILPTQFILPAVKRDGIVINLAEQRLYFYPKDRNVVVTEPVGIGRDQNWETPIGLTKVVKKETDPVWRPTPNVRREAAKNGTPIPSVFPPGPDNPLGQHVFRLGWPTYLIHSTNQPETVGGRVSAGCIRMLPEGIASIFDQVEVGTPVRVINQPYKLGWSDDRLYFEAHHPLSELSAQLPQEKQSLVERISKKLANNHAWVNWKLVQQSAQLFNGFPQIIGQKQ